MKFASTVLLGVILCVLVRPSSALAELTNVKVTSRSVVADGQPFGSNGPYEKLVGRVEFALDPADPHNKAIVDLAFAPRGADGRIHFESDFYVLRPVDVARGNGVMLFEISNRGGKGLLTMFNDAPAAADPTTPAHFGNGFLMREGYTLVWIGWEFDVSPALLKVDAPPVTDGSAPSARPLQVQFILNQRQEGAVLADAPLYPPADPGDAGATLTVRDRFWDSPQLIARDTWRFAPEAGAPRLEMRGGFEPGRLYEVTYRATGRRVAGVGFAAIRDAASAFRSRSDLPVAGRAAYVFGVSQSGRFLRDFLRDGFNADERGRRVFDAVWPHVAGAAGGSFNEIFATPTSASAFVATRSPFLDPLGRYARGQQPKIVYTNTSVEYLGPGARRGVEPYIFRQGRQTPRGCPNLSPVGHTACAVRLPAVENHDAAAWQPGASAGSHAGLAQRTRRLGAPWGSSSRQPVSSRRRQDAGSGCRPPVSPAAGSSGSQNRQRSCASRSGQGRSVPVPRSAGRCRRQ